ncbi:MAG: helix-turn-helix transcriptional regulator [Treponema sp.]|jgi:transcriptional regulator with XRE-family HTH domain|nr:helix-turn-helix transcriptional regulator [Treponema sp.]
MTGVHTLLAQNIKKYRQFLGISQSELAERINCSLTFIGNIEVKKRFPSSKNIDLLAQALGVKPADLFAEENDTETTHRLASKQKQKLLVKKEVLKAIDKAFRSH